MEWVIMSDELMHEGKRDMRWGVRRYQNKDGTWTPLGLKMRRIREGKKRKTSPDAQKRADRKNEIKNLRSKAELDTEKAAYKINKAQNKAAVQAAKSGVSKISTKLKDAAKKAVDARKEKKREESVEEIVRSGDLNKILSSKTKLTEDELRTAVNRIRLEQDLKDAGAREKARGQEAFRKFSDTVSSAAKATTGAIITYNNIAQVMNSLFGKDMKKIGWATPNAQPSSNASSSSPGGSSSSGQSQSSSSNSSNGSSSSSSSSNSSNRSSSSSSSSSSSTGSPIRPNEAVNERARQRAAEANEQRRQSQAQERAQEGFRAWRENTTPPRTVVTGTGTSRQQAESVAERHARERASAVDVESRNVVENEIMPLINDAYFRRRD